MDRGRLFSLDDFWYFLLSCTVQIVNLHVIHQNISVKTVYVKIKKLVVWLITKWLSVLVVWWTLVVDLDLSSECVSIKERKFITFNDFGSRK